MGSKPVSAPIWFLAHGGPTNVFNYDHPAYKHWIKVSQEIKNANLKGIVFISAHWQAEPNEFDDINASNWDKSILINTNSKNPMIYDFYGFPKEFYQVKLESRNPKELQEAVKEQLTKSGYNIQETNRGMDHGLWVPLRAASEKLDTPLIQISLPIAKDPSTDGVNALRLGRALRGLREEGYAIIGGGQPVHNLRDFRALYSGHVFKVGNYSKTFSAALTQALGSVSEKASSIKSDKDGQDPERWNEAKLLFKRSDYIQAHPTSEHLLPALVALGAANDDEPGVEQFAMTEGPLAWNMYRFG